MSDTHQQQGGETQEDAPVYAIDVVEYNLANPENMVQPILQISGTMVTVSFVGNDAFAMTIDASRWQNPTFNFLVQNLNGQTLYPHASEDAQGHVQWAANQFLQARVYGAIATSSGHADTAQSIQFLKQRTGGEFARAYQRATRENGARVTSINNRQNRNSPRDENGENSRRGNGHTSSSSRSIGR